MNKVSKYIMASKTREDVLLCLFRMKIARPSEIAFKIKKSRATLTRIINELRKKKLVEPLEPKRATWKRYILTESGKKVANDIKRLS